ncbi:hypothetical protein JCM8097_002053 [Rhodosporidiobolus ruineniae]
MLLPPALLASTLLASASASPLLKRASAAPTATIANGTVEGFSISTFNDQEAFLGIPFAQPPVGDLRLRKPRVLETTYDGGVYEAKSYSKFCAATGTGRYDNWPYEQSEDCLYLNVVRPAGTKPGDNLPVGFWIHGGGFSMGGSGDLRYNSSHSSSLSSIFVSTNYRTSGLGFLASDESGEDVNLGLYDQRLALNWVQENIAAFGGDPSKVSIWGESAGGSSVGYHLLAYGLTSTPLFRGAIMESGGPSIFTPKNASSYNANYQKVLSAAGCADLDCLRGLSLEKFNETVGAYSWGPIVDGQLVPQSPTSSLKEGKFAPAALLLGANTDEGASFGGSGTNTTSELFDSLARSYPSMSNSSIERLLELYPDDPTVGVPANTGDTVLPGGLQQKRKNAIAGDFSMHAQRRRLAEYYAQAGNAVYSYRFDQPPQNATVLSGVGHFVEVAYVFSVPHEYKTANTLGNRPGDAELAKLTTGQWVSFIHDLDPNGHGIADTPTWPAYAQNATNFVHRRHGSVVEVDDYRKEGIAFIESVAN